MYIYAVIQGAAKGALILLLWLIAINAEKFPIYSLYYSLSMFGVCAVLATAEHFMDKLDG